MKKRIFILPIILLLIPGIAGAVTVGLHGSNVGITSGTWSVVGNTITIDEYWGAAGMGVLEINGLEIGVDYTVIKIVTNNSGVDWDRFAMELLDPGVDPEDIATEAWVPAGFSHSNEFDGLSFAQGSGIPRTSIAFGSRTDDEFAGHDYMDFFNGFVSGAGGIDEISFGLRDNGGTPNQPFLLAQRPNAATGIPEPTTMILMGLGLAGIALRSKFRA